MLKKLKEKLSKKKIITIGIAIIAIITTLVAILLNQPETRTKKKRISADSELARAMTYDQFADGDENVEGTNNVKFSAFFLRDINNDGYAEKIKGTCKEIGKEDTLYMEINVQSEGMLKNGKIEINGKNFYLATTSPKDDQLKDNYISTNTKKIEFNDLNNGTQKLLTGIVRSGDYSYSSSKTSAIGNNINNLSRNDNQIVFTGTYIGSDGNSTEIRKEINLSTDWYGKTTASIGTSTSTYYDIDDRQDETNGTLTLTTGFVAYENTKELKIKKNYVEGTIPQLNGYDPISVTSTTSATFNYDETSRKFTITREAVTDATGNITTTVADTNTYLLNIVYPLEAYKTLDSEVVTIEIPVMTYYEGYNNSNSEFTNPYKSNEARRTLLYTFRHQVVYEKTAEVGIKVGKLVTSPTYRYIISKNKPLKIYNEISSEEKDDTYNVDWYVSKGIQSSSEGLIMKETATGAEQVSDQFIKTDSSKETMENLTRNVGIGFSNSDNFLAEDGWIKVYDDETDELLVTFTKSDWNKYSKDNPYKFKLPVKHIRVETSETQANQYFYVYCKKELDDEYITTNYTREQFDQLQYIRSQMSAYIGNTLLGTISHTAYYEAPYSIANLTISKNILSTQVTEKNEILTISASANESNNQVAWTNGSFLIKMPTDIIATYINNVEINNSSVSLVSYEFIENEQGRFIKINTKNTTNTPQTFEIKIDTNITPDPRISTTTESFELYASNEEGVDYYYNSSDIYDVNDNLNTAEKVHKSTTSISLISPNSLLTNQIASDYDKNGTIVVSPQVADVKPPLATIEHPTEKTVKIGAQIKNNYANSISEVTMLGKIPFEGNTYVISGEDLKSTFTTKMTNAGIEVPEALQGKVKVYYSENETPDKDVSKTENGWKPAEDITNWDNIKTFLIDFQDEKIASGQEYTFYYTVQVPNGTDYNKIAYSHHGVYFSLDTPEGKYRTQTEPNKLGIRIAEKYNLELQKYQTGKDVLVPGATYKVTKEATDDEEEESMTAVTNAEGKLELENLYVKKTYSIEEIKVPTNYELNTDIIKIIGNIQADGSLQITKTQGTTKEDIEVTKPEDENYKIIVKVEDEAKAKLKIVKTEKDTTTPVRGIKYKLTGSGLPENGKVVTTNVNGEISVKGLKVGEEYILEETKGTGYYLASQIKFTITNTDGTYEINVSEGTVKESTITEENNIPTGTLKLEDEKIPTYDLEISKIKRITDTAVTEDELKAKAEQALASTDTIYLAGAKFKLYKGEKELGEYTTDANGKITITGLYQYIDGKDEEAIYSLKEVIAPEGYSKAKDITFKVDGTTGELKLLNTNGDNEPYTVDGNTVKLVMEDSPSFKLIKKDSETQETLANVKFAIYNIDDDTTKSATNSKGEIIGTKETINRKEYYTVTTDDKGEITADLPQGMYKAVEVQADEKYDLTNATYYFGIGTSREGKTGFKATWAQGIGGSNDDQIKSVSKTSDGGILAGGYFKSSSIDLGNEIVLSKKGGEDGMIIKYNAEGECEWAKVIGGSDDDEINSVAETSDGGIIAGGHFRSSSIDLENGITLTRKGSDYTDGMIIKCNSSGECEWAKGIGGSKVDAVTSVIECSDGGIIAGGYFEESIDLGNGVSLTNKGSYDGMIIKYSASGEYEWAKVIGDSNNDQITSVAECSDGGIIAGGYFYSSSIDLGNGVSLSNKGNSDGMIIKYNALGECEWAKGIGGSDWDEINSVAETSDGGIIAGGHFRSSSIDFGNGVVLTNNGSTSYSDGMIIKYSSSGDCEWAKGIGGNNSDEILSVAETKDGGVIAGGTFYSKSIDLGNGIILTNKNSGYTDGMIIKYNSEGECKWAKVIGEDNYDYIESVAETSDGGIIAGGKFRSQSIDLGNGVSLSNKGDHDGMLIKYEKIELPNPVIVQATGIGDNNQYYITSVASTSDGGYVAGGYFSSSSIDLGNGEVLTNKGKKDGMIIKYSSSGECEWAKVIGGSGYDEINAVAETRDGGIIVGGTFSSNNIDLENGVSFSGSCMQIIKYSNREEVEWTRTIGDSSNNGIKAVTETKDGGIIVGGYFQGENINLEKGVSLSNKGSWDGIIVKLNSAGNIEWAKGIGGSDWDEINSVAETSDGGIIVGGKFRSQSIDLGNGVILSNKGKEDGMIIKYSAEGECEWAKGIGGKSDDKITSVVETRDGGILVGGYFESSIDLGNGVRLINNITSYSDGMIIKYNAEGECEWAKGIGGDNYDYIESVAETSDGGIVAGGQFYSSSIDLENGVILTNKGNLDGMIIKYNSSGECEWAKGIGGSKSDSISSVAETRDGDIVARGYFQSPTIEIDEKTLNVSNSESRILKITNKTGVPETQELTVENTRKEFKITTDVQEIDGTKGGSISGEKASPYETVKYGDSSEKEIKMTPDENYEIIKITVNGQEYPFTANEDGTYTMPAFTNMAEDKKVVVTYALKNNKITINKVDSKTKEKLSGASFKLDQIEERNKPNNSDVIGELTDNGQEYTEVTRADEVTGKIGELTNNGTYYFVQNEDGTYTPTNSKTYQTENGGTAGIQSSTANSYIQIDLTNETGKYVVVVNASCSSESGYDYGYATITENTTAPSYSDGTGRFVYISGTQSAKDYQTVLEGGKTYYLHLGYRKDSSGDKNDDQIAINSVKLYNANVVSNTYNFTNNDGKFESTNQGKDSTVANSYIPIDLTNYTGKYNLTVNAQVSSENSDYGYATITENTTRPSYSSSTGRFVYISGTQDAKDYTTVLQGGKMYYLHLGYYKDESTSSGDDKFTVNSVNISLNDSELYHTTVETNSEGQAITQIPFGKYKITETKAPEGYWLNETPMEVEFRSTEGSVHEFTMENEAKAKLIVHHYIKGTTTKLAEDETSEARAGDSYTTNPKLDLDKYELEKDDTGNLVMPSNAVGTYSDGTTEVTYYYVEKEIPLTVHHYIEGTTTQVPLKTGGTAGDQISKGKEGESYTTSPIADENLSSEYELSSTPDNANGTYTGSEVIVTYYYKKVERKVTLQKYQNDGTTPLQGAKFTIKDKNSGLQDGVIVGNIKNNGTYYFEEKGKTYISNNKGKSSSVASSYIKIDLTKTTENISVTVNAEVSSESGYDFGYATITENTTVPSYDSSAGQFIKISGSVSAKDYTTELEKGKVYYLHFGYRKDSSSDSGTDTFTINSIKINNIDYLKFLKTYTTDAQGKIEETLKSGTYEITEIETPEGYKLPENPTTEVTITKETPATINITNEKKTGTVTVHYYIEGTTDKVPLADGSTAEDEVKTGNVGDMYVTKAKDNVSDSYDLVAEPENSSGNYIDGNIEVTYYYRPKATSVLVHHYIEGTTTSLAEDETIEGKVGDEYTTSEATVDNKYELVSTPANATGTMIKDQTVVIYYYKLKDTSVLVHHYVKDTTTKLSEDVTINGKVDDSYTTTRASDIPEYYELVAEPSNKNGTMTIDQIEVTYYYQLKKYPYTVNYLEKGTNKVLHTAKTGDEQTWGTVIKTTDETIDIDGYSYNSADKDSLTIGVTGNVINIYYEKVTGLSYTVNYLEKDTNKVIHPAKTTGEQTFETEIESANEVIDIDGYNYNSVDKDKLIIGTGENVINIYYTKKDAKVTVHYYEENTTNKVSEDVEITGKVFDDYNTTVANDIPSKYELVAEPENKSGKMTEEDITVIYYFRKKATQVNVHYYEEETTNKLSEDVTITGRVDDPYTTISAEDVPIKYELVAEPENKAGSMTEETIEVIYYYRVKDAEVNIRYLEKGTDKVLADPTQLNGKVDEEYQTEPKEIEGYKLVEHSGNEKGKFEVAPLTITYYYLYKTKATVQYIDKMTGQILEQSTTEGLEGDEFVTESKDFENYILVEEPEEKTVKMTKEEQILKYYYIHVSGGVIEKHIDEISGEILANQIHEGKEGDEFDIPSRTFEGYDLVEDKLPTNAKGTMKTEPEEVIYYYIYKTKVTAEYVDKNTGKKLTEDEVQTGHEKDSYTTERKTFDDYKLVEVPANADGEMTKDDIKVTYYYAHTSGGVIVNHIDIKTGKQLLDETKQEGYEGDPYETHEENIPEYELVKDKYPEKAKGTMTIEPTRVTYYYIKKTGVKVKYIDEATGEEIEETIDISGHEGDEYTTEEKDIKGYDLVKEPENKNGTITDTPTEVIYYYRRPAKVVVNYYDEETNEKIAEEITIEGHENDEYQTEQKEIKYYEITKVADNKEGKMTVKVTKDENGKDIVEDTTYVNYYYRKMMFNMKIDKTVESIIVDGQEQQVNGDLGKVEVPRKELSTAKVQVKYKIAITNDSELTGKAVIMEDIPNGMIMKAENNPGWDIKETTATRETEEMKPGETQEYQVVLDWNNGENNIGMKGNTATITTQNEAGFEEKDTTDNEDKADIIVAIGTGEVPYVLIAAGVLIIMLAVTAGVYIIKRVGVEK